MSNTIDTNTTVDFLSVIHRNVYRMSIDPNQRCMIKKYLRLIEHELDENLGVPGPAYPQYPYGFPQPPNRPSPSGR